MNIALTSAFAFGTANACRKPCGTYSLFCLTGSSKYAFVKPNVFESGLASVIMS